LITSKKVKSECRPYVRTFAKNKLNFLKYLQACDWNQIYQDDDVNTAYSKFLGFITCAFNNSFKFVKVSRKRSRDKPWVTPALKKSRKIKNKLYRKWILTKNKDDECAYKRYKKVYNRVAAEAQDNHYRQMFDIRNNSVIKLWNNINIVCSFKHCKSKRNITHTHTHPFNGPFSGTTAPRSRQITTPAPHHSVFYRPDALPATQPTASKH